MSTNGPTKAGVLLGLFALTASGLALEVAITRLFSFLFIQSYVYIIISLSISGIGLGAVFMYYLKPRRRLPFLGTLPVVVMALAVLLFGINMVTSSVVASLAVTFAIYVTIGATQVHVFREGQVPVSQLYAADLIGAATGSVLAFFLLNAAGAVDGVIIVTAVMSFAIAGLVLAFSSATSRALITGAVVVVVVIVGLVTPLDRQLMPASTWEKEMTAMLDDPESESRITETRWSAFGRVDVVETDNALFKTMFVDGGAGTKIVGMENGQVSRAVAQTLLFQYMGGVPLLATDRDRRERAVVIGSGGGIDVVTLLIAGYNQIDAVEINPDFIDIVQEQSDYSGGIYTDHERINVHETEGRSFLRTTPQRYDVVLMGLPIIKSVRNFGNHALTENYLFTHNAFTEYRAALDDGGLIVVIAHYKNELLRLVSNTLKSFQEQGLTLEDAAKRIVTLGDPQNPTLIVKNEPFTDSERAGFVAILESIPTRPDMSFVPGQAPQVAQGLGFNAGLLSAADGSADLAAFAAVADQNVSWISDDSPFFYQLTTSVPQEIAIVALVVLLLVTVAAVLFSIDLRRRGVERSGSAARFAAFALIGIGYISVEIAVLQRFIVFWQHQTLALAVVLSAVLVASGVGSLISARIRSAKTLAMILGGVVLVVAATLLFLEPTLRSLEGANPVTKVLVTVAVTAPIFLPLGMPFPFLLRNSTETRYPWMIGINSLTTLAGGVLAMIVALQFGYTFVMISGLLAYLAVIVIQYAGRAASAN
ncbi:MAG: hypothetical protein GVY29_02455 [Spirochaetes bacterium]|jgi:hypothetical protein|nr:hypothetical protein [Spirochaetota bacterium]